MGKDSLLDRVGKVRKALADKLPPRPPNVFTTAEYAKHQGISAPYATLLVRRMAEAGKLRHVSVKVVTISGRIQTVGAWELID